MEPQRNSYWNNTSAATDFPQLSGNLNVDVAIVGGGIAGTTTARLLKDSGLSVALVEAAKIGRQATGKSTAKVSSQHALIYQKLADKFSNTYAQHYADAQQHGLDTIRQLVAEHNIDCSLETATAYVYAPDKNSVDAIKKEAEITQQLGLPASFVNDTDLPFSVEGALCFADQLRFHPTRYVSGLAQTIPGDGCHVFENSRVISWESDHVATATGTVHAKHVVMATHLPLGMIGGYYSRAFPNFEPVVAARVGHAPKEMYLSAGSPSYSFNSFRDENDQVYAVATGSPFKGGDADAQSSRLSEVETWLRKHFDVISIEHRWINEDYSSVDNAPYVGYSSFGGDYLVATGFAGWGLTNGTAAATMLRDLIMDRDNPWLELFDAKRLKPVAGGPKFVKETAHVVSEFSKGHLNDTEQALDQLKAGEGVVIKADGEQIAVARDMDSKLHRVSAVCSHLGCIVGWNKTDQTWDCPCHGSRFTNEGEVLHGPAVDPLDKK